MTEQRDGNRQETERSGSLKYYVTAMGIDPATGDTDYTVFEMSEEAARKVQAFDDKLRVIQWVTAAKYTLRGNEKAPQERGDGFLDDYVKEAGPIRKMRTDVFSECARLAGRFRTPERQPYALGAVLDERQLPGNFERLTDRMAVLVRTK
jgi:hypothetical protein